MSQRVSTLLFMMAGLSILYSISISLVLDCKAKKLAQRVKANYPETWMSLPWILRKIVKTDIGLRRLHRAQLIDNALFAEEYNALHKYDRHIWLSLFCSLAFLVLVLTV